MATEVWSECIVLMAQQGKFTHLRGLVQWDVSASSGTVDPSVSEPKIQHCSALKHQLPSARFLG